jgi:hypothetical protein
MPHDALPFVAGQIIKPVLGYFASSPSFITPCDAQDSKANDPRWDAYAASQPPLKPNRSLARAPCLHFPARGKKTKCARHAILGVAVVYTAGRNALGED